MVQASVFLVVAAVAVERAAVGLAVVAAVVVVAVDPAVVVLAAVLCLAVRPFGHLPIRLLHRAEWLEN